MDVDSAFRQLTLPPELVASDPRDARSPAKWKSGCLHCYNPESALRLQAFFPRLPPIKKCEWDLRVDLRTTE